MVCRKILQMIEDTIFLYDKVQRKLIHKSNNSLHQDKQSMLDNIKCRYPYFIVLAW